MAPNRQCKARAGRGESLRVAVNDTLFVVETEHGLLLTPFHSLALAAVKDAERAAERYRNALRDLAR